MDFYEVLDQLALSHPGEGIFAEVVWMERSVIQDETKQTK